MADIDRKIADRVLQLGSLNDELKRVVEQTNQKNQELEELNLNLLNTKESLDKAERELANFKNKNLSEELRLREQSRVLSEEIELRQKDKEVILESISHLEADKRILKNDIKSLEDTKSQLVELQNKLKTLRSKELAYDKFALSILKLSGDKSRLLTEVKEIQNKLKELKTQLISEKKRHREWLKNSKQTADRIMNSSVSRVDDLEKTKKDLRIVVKRLKKLWEQNSSIPFPKVYNA